MKRNLFIPLSWIASVRLDCQAGQLRELMAIDVSIVGQLKSVVHRVVAYKVHRANAIALAGSGCFRSITQWRATAPPKQRAELRAVVRWEGYFLREVVEHYLVELPHRRKCKMPKVGSNPLPEHSLAAHLC